LLHVLKSEKWRWLLGPMIGVAVGFVVMAAIGRQRLLESISPTDLAFFHQSTWSALVGEGFRQTALRFDGSQLFSCIHLSLHRLTGVLIYALHPGVGVLVAAQAMVVMAGAIPAARLARASGGTIEAQWLTAAMYLSHPWTLELAHADFRPITWMIPGVLWAMVGLRTGRGLPLVCGVLWAAAAREEAPWVLLTLIPWGVWAARHSRHPWNGAGERDRARDRGGDGDGDGDGERNAKREGDAHLGRRWWPLGALVGLAVMILIGLKLCWGQWFTLVGAQTPFETLEAILSGQRAFFRTPQEGLYGALALLVALPAVRVPRLLVPGVGAWLLLTVFSSYEGVGPSGRGVHYLAVVFPFLLGAAAVGLGRLTRGLQGSVGGIRTRRCLGWAAVALLVGNVCVAHYLGMLEPRLRWGAAALRGTGPGTEMVGVLGGIEPSIGMAASLESVRAASGGVLTEPRFAGWLANRRSLHILGEMGADTLTVSATLAEVDWAIIRLPDSLVKALNTGGLEAGMGSTYSGQRWIDWIHAHAVVQPTEPPGTENQERWVWLEALHHSGFTPWVGSGDIVFWIRSGGGGGSP